MTTSTHTEPEAEPKAKPLAQYKRELDVLLQEYLDASAALAGAPEQGRAETQKTLDDVKVRLGKLKVQAGAMLDDANWALFLEHLNNGLENVESLQTVRRVDLHRKNTREKIVEATGEVVMGTAEVTNRGVNAVGYVATGAIEAIAETTFVGAAKILRAAGKGWTHLFEKGKRKTK